MGQVICGAGSCAFNQSGVCSAGILRIEEAILGKKGPYCETFSRRGDLSNSLSLNRRLRESGSVCCAMNLCIHNSHGLCHADPLHMLPPQHRETPFVPCGSFQK